MLIIGCRFLIEYNTEVKEGNQISTFDDCDIAGATNIQKSAAQPVVTTVRLTTKPALCRGNQSKRFLDTI